MRVAGQGCGDPVRRRASRGSGSRLPETRRNKAEQEQPPHAPSRLPQSRERATPTVRPNHPFEPVLRYVDDAVVVVDKPPGMTTHRSADEAAEFGTRGKRFLPVDAGRPVAGPAAGRRAGAGRSPHRSGHERTGRVRPHAGGRGRAGQAVPGHTVGRRYLAITRGRPAEGRIESWLVRDRGDGRRGSGPPGRRPTGRDARPGAGRDWAVLPGRMPAGNGPHASGAHPSGRSRGAAGRREGVRSARERPAGAGPERGTADRVACRLSGIYAPDNAAVGRMGIAAAGGLAGGGAAAASAVDGRCQASPAAGRRDGQHADREADRRRQQEAPAGRRPSLASYRHDLQFGVRQLVCRRRA